DENLNIVQITKKKNTSTHHWLYLLNIKQCYEKKAFYAFLHSYELPKERCDIIPLTNYLNADQLLLLSKQQNLEILKKNGFNVISKLNEDLSTQEEDAEYFLDAKCNHIPNYGIEDFLEILNLMKEYENEEELYKFRPKKVIEYFKEMAIKFVNSKSQ